MPNGIRLNWRRPRKRLSGCVLVLSLGIVGLLPGCGSSIASQLAVQLPVLGLAPTYHPCPEHPSDACVTLLADDYDELVIRLKQACTYLGGSGTECQLE